MELAAWLQVGLGFMQVFLTIIQIKSVKNQSASQLAHSSIGAQAGLFVRIFPYLNFIIIILTLGNIGRLLASKSALSKSDYFAIAMGFSLLVFIGLARYVDKAFEAIISMQKKCSSEILRLQTLIEQNQKLSEHKSKSNSNRPRQK